MNKYRQNYIEINILANILVNSQLCIIYVLMERVDKEKVYQYIISVLSFLKWKKIYNKSNNVKEKYKCSLLLNK